MVDFMILGAQKAATSSLQAALRQMKSIYMPVGESPFFEEPDYNQEPWKSFQDPKGLQRILGIKRPDNLCSSVLIDRISGELPELKCIVVMREPVSRAVSSYYHLMRHGHLPYLPLNDGMKRCLEHYHQQKAGRTKTVIEYGLYGTFLQKWLEKYSYDQFLLLNDNEVRNNFNSVLLACCNFLGVDFNYETAPGEKKKNVGLYAGPLIRFNRFGNILKTRKLTVNDRRLPSKNVFKRTIGIGIVVSTRFLAPLFKNTPDDIDKDVKTELKKIYAKDLKILKKIISPEKIYWDY